MLQIKNISKTYITGDLEQTALNDVTISFRDSEFVAVLGPSGSGKTTFLNIIGGLDRYDDGDLIVDGVSTKHYKDRDWDSYRNHAVGFVFQSYNLIPHQSVLANVELALTISGVPRQERRQRAEDALRAVGLGDQMHKRPNQMSGGQMQRVAIARALVNDPAILLADEPTGALDTDTSIAIMDLLKEVSKDRLVVMVTHNPELAEEYATRIVSLRDGVIEGDTDPFEVAEAAEKPEHRSMGHASMSFPNALSLSFNNLRTKKARTLLTAFAGSIGIIGIALILSLSNGVNGYIESIEQDTMGNYPIELEKETVDLQSMMASAPRGGLDSSDDSSHDADAVYSNNVVGDTVSATHEMISKNNLGAFKAYYEQHEDDLDGAVSAVEYGYAITPQVYRLDGEEASQVSPASIEQDDGGMQMPSGGLGMGAMSSSTSTAWLQLPKDETLQQANYELLSGDWPQGADEVALVVSPNNEVSDFVLYTLGLMDSEHMEEVIKAAEDGIEIDDPQQRFTYDEVIGLEYKVLAPCQLYYAEDGVWVDGSDDEGFVAQMAAEGRTVRISAVLRAGDEADIASGVGYTSELTDELMLLTETSEVVQDQLADPSKNILTGEAFEEDQEGEPAAESDQGDTSTSQVSYASSGARTDSSTEPRVSTAVYRPGTPAVSSRSLVASAAQEPPSSDSDTGTEEGEGQPPLAERFTVAFDNYDGSTLLGAHEYEKDSPITDLPSEDPIRPSDATYEYTFIGWKSSATNGVYKTADLPLVTQNVTYTAYYYASPVKSPGQEKPEGGTPTMPGEGISQTPGGVQMPNGATTPDAFGMAGGSMPSGMSGFDLSSMGAMDMSGFNASGAMDLTDAQLAVLLAQMSDSTPSTYEDVLAALGYAVPEEPSSIKIYPVDFDGKEKVEELIASYNDQASEANQVTYTDMVGLLVSSVTSIVDMISYVLIAFVAISLIVSSIMIGIITYISVLERTKEIGILRAIGASKRNISEVFNAETFIVGLLSGLIGISLATLLLIPGNAIIHAMTGMTSVNAVLPATSAVILIALSVLLTLVGGIIPAKSAARKDPVAALRSE